MSASRPSSRLVRAVEAERVDLVRQRARLTEEAEALRSSLARIEHGLVELDERRALLDRLAPASAAATPEREHQHERERAAQHAGTRLRGPAIREAAVRLLAARGGEALHYREWFELLTRAGYEIAGKDPAAVFLTQLSRSPAVRKGTRAGVYELDRHAAARLRASLEALVGELRGLTAAPPGSDLAALRARRAQLTAEIGRAERALDEVARVLAPARTLAAAG